MALSLPNDPWTIRRVVSWATDDLKKRGAASPRLDVELLLGKVLTLDRVRLLIDAERPLSKEELARYKALHERRRAGEPVAYLVGIREFYGRLFRVDARVLVPRPDTEALVEVALERTRRLSLSVRALDLCTGSGCVATTLARERPTTSVIGSDISAEALVVARENALRLGAINVGFIVSDLFAAFERANPVFDLVTANPPYIAAAELAELMPDVRDFEPHVALTPGPDGLALARAIVRAAPRFLASGGVLAIEVGAGQADEAAGLFAAAGFTDVSKRRDLGGHERVVSGVRGATS